MTADPTRRYTHANKFLNCGSWLVTRRNKIITTNLFLVSDIHSPQLLPVAARHCHQHQTQQKENSPHHLSAHDSVASLYSTNRRRLCVRLSLYVLLSVVGPWNTSRKKPVRKTNETVCCEFYNLLGSLSPPPLLSAKKNKRANRPIRVCSSCWKITK